MADRPDPDSGVNSPRWSRTFSESLNRKRSRRPRKARINWGYGRLAAFSSQASFIAQFCVLNDLKFPEFERFIAGYFGRDVDCWRVFSDEHLLRMARLLDEPLAIVKTLRNDCFTLPACFGEFTFHSSNVTSSKYVSYCPVCLVSGYHGAFHEAPWLYRCPLHREPLKREPVLGGPVAYVRAVAELLRCTCASWPDVWRENFETDGSLQLLWRWLKLARDRATRLHSQSAASLRESPYSFHNLDILLGRLDSIAPIPTELFDLFLVSPRRQQQGRVEVARDAVSMVKALGKKFPLWFLLWYFNKYEAVFSGRRCSRLLADQAIETLKQEHTVCRCHWAWDRYASWEPINSDEKRASWRLCPYEYAIKELKERWLVFTSSEASPQAANKIENQFLEGCRMVLENGLGYLPDTPISIPPNQGGVITGFLLPKLTLGDDVEYMLDSLLAGQVTAHCEELTAWLAAITSDCRPLQPTPAGSTNLFLDDRAAWVSTWKCLEARSADDAVALSDEGRLRSPWSQAPRTRYSVP